MLTREILVGWLVGWLVWFGFGFPLFGFSLPRPDENIPELDLWASVTLSTSRRKCEEVGSDVIT